MDEALAHQIQHLERSRQMLGRVDNEILEAGLELFDSEAALAEWLTTPAHALARDLKITAACGHLLYPSVTFWGRRCENVGMSWNHGEACSSALFTNHIV
ncbi:MAG: hypothetical protein PSV13_19265 [Lacunisphaera sp.]|nr:hypothetical protein [Lacunisphaera sp.]